jgi:hypothetical protein
MAWPPTLDALKLDASIDDTRDDAVLQLQLDAAVSFVETVRAGSFNFGGSAMLPAPGPTIELGTIRLAIRWHTRRRSPDGLIAMAELGASRVPAFDADIERLLGIGRYAGPVIA